MSACKLLSGLRAEECGAQLLHFRRGERIWDELCGEPAVGLVAEGIVDVYSVSPDKAQVKLSELGEGEMFGINNLFVPQALRTQLRCRTEARILFIPKHFVAEFFLKEPGRMQQYAALLNQKVQFLIRRIGMLTMPSTRGRLACYLLEAADGEGLVRNLVSKEQLAKTLGVSRAALFRELAFLQNQELILQEDAGIRVLDRPALEAVVGSAQEEDA